MMYKLVNFFLLLTATLLYQSVGQAVVVTSTRNISTTVEPIIGIEQVYRSTPTAHTVSRAIYGARLAVGNEKLAGEGEYIKAEDTENFTSAPQKITNKDDKIKIGARTSMSFKNNFFATGRAGLQASKNINEVTNNSALTSSEGSFQYNPYAGAYIGYKVGKYVSLSVGSVVVFKELGDLTKNEYQNTFSINLGN